MSRRATDESSKEGDRVNAGVWVERNRVWAGMSVVERRAYVQGQMYAYRDVFDVLSEAFKTDADVRAVHVNSGPPTWWLPRVDVRRGTVMVGWLRGLLGISWDAS